jgi:hypothetical protein
MIIDLIMSRARSLKVDLIWVYNPIQSNQIKSRDLQNLCFINKLLIILVLY